MVAPLPPRTSDRSRHRLLAFPELVYDRYVWQYLWGPVVADAVGQSVTYQDITAVKGYNPVNTLTYVALVLYALPGVQAFFATFDIDLDTELACSLAPILVAGGVMRALEDAGRLPVPLDRLFITPSIYFVIAELTVLASSSVSLFAIEPVYLTLSRS